MANVTAWHRWGDPPKTSQNVIFFVVWGLLILQIVMRRRMTFSFLERVHMRETQVGWGSIFHSARWMNPWIFIRGFIIWLRNRWSHFFKADCYLVFTVWEIVPVPCKMSLKQTYRANASNFQKHLSRRYLSIHLHYCISRMNHSNSTRAHNLGYPWTLLLISKRFPFIAPFEILESSPGGCCYLCLLRGGIRWIFSSILGCELHSNSGKWRFRLGSPTKRYHALTWLPHKAHLRISPNGIADMCTRENSQTIGNTMDIFPSPSMLETRHFIFPCEGHHCVLWGLSSSRQSCISDILGNRLVCMIFASLRMLQVTQGRYYMFSMARTHTQSMRVASRIHLSCEFGGVPLPRLSSVFAVVSEQHRFLYTFCVLLFWNCLFFLGLFCFPSALLCFLAPLSFLFSAIRHRIFSAKGWEHVSIRWLLEPQTEHCGFRRPLPRLVMFDLKHKHLFW